MTRPSRDQVPYPVMPGDDTTHPHASSAPQMDHPDVVAANTAHGVGGRRDGDDGADTAPKPTNAATGPTTPVGA